MSIGGPIQLLNLSRDQLRTLAGQQSLKPAATASKKDLIQQLSQELTPQQLMAAAEDYLYAGRTSVSWVQLSGGAIQPRDLRGAVMLVCGADPFANDLRPELDSTPRLLTAANWRDGKVVMTFAVRGPDKLVFQGYELQEVREDVSLEAIVRLSDAVFEIRSSHLYAQRLRKGFVTELAAALGRTASGLPVGDAQLSALRESLGAMLTEYTGLDSSPSPFGAESVKKADSCLDLAAEPKFQERYGGLDTVGCHVAFTGAEQEGVKARIALNSNTVYFVSTVPEATIDLVYDTLKGVWP